MGVQEQDLFFIHYLFSSQKLYYQIVYCGNCPPQLSLINFIKFDSFNKNNSYQYGPSSSFQPNKWVISNQSDVKNGINQIGVKVLTCDQGQKTYYLQKDDNNIDDVVYQIQITTPKNTKRIQINTQIIKVKDFSEQDKIYIDVIEGTINNPKRAQSFPFPTTQQSGVSFSCAGIGYYPQIIQVTANALEGQFFIRIRLQSNKNIFGIESFSVDALFLEDINNGDCNNNILTECSQLPGTILDPSLKQCIQGSACKQKKFMYSTQSKTCVKNCSVYETQINLASPYCVENTWPCDELKFGRCSVCDIGQYQCFTCQQDYVLKNGFCIGSSNSCQDTQYYDSRSGQCIECNKTLQNCSRCQSSNQCIQCATGYYISSPDNDGTLFTCQKCPDGCKSCYFSNSCDSCNSPFSLVNGICHIQCNANQVQENDKCVNCPSNCQSCTSSTTCQLCNTGFLLQNAAQCVISCDLGYVKNGNSCDACSSDCSKCASKTQCTECNTGYELINNTCKAKCNPSQFRDASYNCQNCLINCTTCTSLTNCSLCQSPYLLQNNSKCLNGCDKGYFQQNITCLPCINDCDLCMNANNCLNCKSGYTYIASLNQCLISCLSTEFRSSTDPTKCESCLNLNPNCQSCTSNTSCTQCLNNMKIQEGLCVVECSNGYFQENNNCIKCMANCSECSSVTSCTKCNPGFEYLSSVAKCDPLCQAGKFRNSLQGCSNCISNCSQCSDDSKCIVCATNYQKNTLNQCVITCQDGQYLNGSSCSECMVGCQICTSLNDCTNCKSAYDLIQGKCYSQCKSNQFRNPSNNQCLDCPKNCQTCSNSGDCQTCITGYQFDLQIKECLIQCPPGKYSSIDGNSCLNCSPNCIKCTSDKQCITCETDYILDQSICKINCKTQQYRINDTQCGNCPTGCSQCDSLTLCKSCDNNLAQYDLINNVCMPKCQSNQYRDTQNQCKDCSSIYSNCLECDQSKCLKCNDYIQNNVCVNSCDLGYFADLLNSCEKCITGCKNCQNSSTCDSCKDGYSLTASKTCISNCQSNEYYTGNSCEKCPTNCSTCQSLDECKSCIINYELVDKKCMSICKDNQFRDPNQNNNCQSCPLNCSKCTKSDICNECQNLYELVDNQCLSPCQKGEVRDKSDNICRSCQKLMQGCINCTTSNTCIECDPNHKLIGNSCFEMCQSNQFRNIENKCISCMQGCLKCSSLQSCDECDENNYFFKNSNFCLERNNDIIRNGFKLKPTSPLTGDQMPVVTLYFSKPLTDQDQNEQTILNAILISITDYNQNADFTVKVTIISSTQVELHFDMKRSIKNKDIKVTLRDDNFIKRNNFTNQEEIIIQNGNFPNYVPVDPSTKEQTAAIKNVGQAISTSIVSSVIPIILFSNFSILFNTLDLLQMISYLKYVNIRHPYNIIAFLEIFTAFQFPWSPNINDIIEKQGQGLDNNGQSLHLNGPIKYTLQEYDCLFLSNSGQDITQYLILLLAHLILRILCLQKINPFTCVRSFIYKKIKNGWEWGWHLDCLWDIYLALVVSSFIPYYEIFNNPQSDSLSIANYFLSIIFSIIVIAIPVSFTYKIMMNQQKLEDQQFKEKWGMLFEGIKIYNSLPNETELFKNKNSNSSIRNNFLKIIPLNQGKKQSQELMNNEKNSISVLDDETNTPQQTFNERTQLKQDIFSKKIISSNNSTNIPLFSLFNPSTSNNNTSSQPTQIEQQLQVSNYQQTSSNLSKLKKDYFKMEQNTSLSKLTKYYYCILYFRKLLFGFFILFLHSAPLAQLFLLDSLNISIFLFILNTKPYENNLENIKSSICEIFIIAAQVCLKILIKDGENQQEEDRLKVGWVFISACCSILLIQLFFLLYSFFTPLYTKVKEKCLKRKQNKVAPDNQTNMRKIVIKDCELSFNKLKIPKCLALQGENTLKSQDTVHLQQTNFHSTLEKLNTSHLNQSQQMTNQCSQDFLNDNSVVQIQKIELNGNKTENNITVDNTTFQQLQDENNNLTFRQEQGVSQSN